MSKRREEEATEKSIEVKAATEMMTSKQMREGAEQEYVLLQVDEELLSAMKRNQLVFKGQPDDEAVLCTSSTTHRVRKVESSNVFLLLDPSTGLVHANLGSHLELELIHPVYDRLFELIKQSGLYAGPDMDALLDMAHGSSSSSSSSSSSPSSSTVLKSNYQKQQRKLWTTEELEKEPSLQISSRQVRSGLKKHLEAVQIDGYWRILDPDYLAEILQVLAASAIEQDWDLNYLSSTECIQHMCSQEADYPPIVIAHILRIFGEKITPDPTRKRARDHDVSDVFWKMNFYKLAQILSLNLLKKQHHSSWTDLLNAATAILPEESRDPSSDASITEPVFEFTQDGCRFGVIRIRQPLDQPQRKLILS